MNNNIRAGTRQRQGDLTSYPLSAAGDKSALTGQIRTAYFATSNNTNQVSRSV